MFRGCLGDSVAEVDAPLTSKLEVSSETLKMEAADRVEEDLAMLLGHRLRFGLAGIFPLHWDLLIGSSDLTFG